MAILVTGGAGYIGSHMVQELVDAGDQVVVLDNLSTGFRYLLPNQVPVIVGSTGDRDLLTQAMTKHRIDAVIHFAASVVVPDSVRDPLGYYLNNTMNTAILVDAAVHSGVKQFIFSSTAAVYGNAETSPVREETPTKPISPYGTSKLMSEIMLHDAARAHDLRFVVLRYFNVAGADPKLRTGQSTPNATHLIKVACEVALGRRPKLDVFGTDYPTRDGTCIRDYIHVSDLARAHSAALGYLRRGGASATFNCGYGHGFSVLEVIEAVKRANGGDFPVEATERRPGDPATLVADVGRLRATLDWRPQFDNLDTIVTHALAWERRLGSRRSS
ncbi:MAG: UDP-glucose 4-epimerase GalE [Pseudolabrys sp.]|nr:UDP-glucose 4-epimerase GalE [Pseudolabrys sp.]MBV9956690.1 UDP-glucose 4-epimerase GalE [Pseudolabrys sp.]